jgi:chemotaxis signal transduction protein
MRMSGRNDSSNTGANPAGKKLQLLRAGAREFGIFAEHVAAVVDWREPTPLPHAPASVLGVISVHGRMLTVLDLAALQKQDKEPATGGRPNQIIALKGEEQLALGVESSGETIELTAADEIITDNNSPLVLGTLKTGDTSVLILNMNELFPVSIQGRERRRRRF